MSEQDQPNNTPSDQAAYWNEDGGRRWVANIARVERMLQPLADELLALAAPAPGELALDVGCGGGLTSAAFARAVAPAGRVLGLDVSAVILDVARERFKGSANLEFALGDAATMALADYDLVTSRFGVMFFPTPVAAFSNLRRALRGDGRLAFICWRALDENPWMAAPTRAAFTVLPRPEPTPPGAPGPFAFADGNRLRGILEEAGFGTISIEAHDCVLDLGTPEDALEQMTRMGPAAAAFTAAAPDEQRAAADAVRAALEDHVVDGTVRMSSGTWLVRARPS
jgi:SAM-dependent methyltransferase